MRILITLCLVILFYLPVKAEKEDYLYTSYGRVEALPGEHNGKKIRLVGVLGIFKNQSMYHYYLFDSKERYVNEVYGTGIPLYLHPEKNLEEIGPLDELSGKYVEVWGEYLGPRSIEDKFYIGNLLGGIYDVIWITSAETVESEKKE